MIFYGKLSPIQQARRMDFEALRKKKKNRPKGLKYKIKVINKAWIKKGQHLSPETEWKKGQDSGRQIKKGEHLSPATEFKKKVA